MSALLPEADTAAGVFRFPLDGRELKVGRDASCEFGIKYRLK